MPEQHDDDPARARAYRDNVAPKTGDYLAILSWMALLFVVPLWLGGAINASNAVMYFLVAVLTPLLICCATRIPTPDVGWPTLASRFAWKFFVDIGTIGATLAALVALVAEIGPPITTPGGVLVILEATITKIPLWAGIIIALLVVIFVRLGRVPRCTSALLRLGASPMVRRERLAVGEAKGNL
jgi:hypothetical protein